MNHRAAGRHLGATLGAFLRLALIALFQHTADFLGGPQKRRGAIGKSAARLKKNLFWRTFGGLRCKGGIRRFA
jgi:hypothetical protein